MKRKDMRRMSYQDTDLLDLLCVLTTGKSTAVKIYFDFINRNDLLILTFLRKGMLIIEDKYSPLLKLHCEREAGEAVSILITDPVSDEQFEMLTELFDRIGIVETD